MQRYKADDSKFKPIHSEKILEIAEVARFGLEVFGDMESFKLWLNTPSFALGKMKPIDLLGDSYGKELVMTELTHIEYGIFG
jgi:putative toxin-antitoxin system antitoxin component (TIGR02293 family)